MFSVKAQVSSELIISISVLLLLFFVILIFSANMRLQSDLLSEKADSSAICYSLASLLSKANTQNFFELQLKLDKDVLISGNMIIVGNASCNFFGNLSETNLTAGNIQIIKDSSLEVKNV